MAAIDKYPFIRCKKCGDVICSENRYDREECSCGSIGIWDGPRCPTIMWPGDKTAEEAFEWVGWGGKDPQYSKAEKRMTVEKSRCINCKYCECRDEDQYFCIAKSERGKQLNSYRTILREANGRDFPYFCPLPENRKIIEDDIARRKDQRENRLINRVETCARDLVFALMEADIVKTKWEPAMELHGKKYRLEWSVIEEEAE